MKKNNPYKIIFTGPESSGKTTLTQKAANLYQTDWHPEYSRIFLNRTNGQYQPKDLVTIAEGQKQSECSFVKKHKDKRILFFDTSFLVLKIWSQYKYGFYNFRIEQLLRKHLPDLYFLCDWNIPWEQDPLRENPNEREILYHFYKSELLRLGIPFFEIKGNLSERTNQVTNILRVFL